MTLLSLLTAAAILIILSCAIWLVQKAAIAASDPDHPFGQVEFAVSSHRPIIVRLRNMLVRIHIHRPTRRHHTIMIKLFTIGFFFFILTRFTKQLKSIDSIPVEFIKTKLMMRITVSCAIVLLITSIIILMVNF